MSPNETEAGAVPNGVSPRSRRYVDWLIRHYRLVLVFGTVLAIAAGYRTVLTYSHLRSDLEELLPASAPSVAALDTLRARLPGLRHLGVVVDTGGEENVPAANRFLDDLRLRILEYPKDAVASVRVGMTKEREFAETYALQLMDPEDVRTLREAVEERRDWEVTQASGMSLFDEDEDPAPEIPIEQLQKKYRERHGGGREFPDDRFVSEDRNTAVLLIRAGTHDSGISSDKVLLARVQKDIEELGFPDAYAPGMRVGYAGDVASRTEELSGLVVDLSVSAALVLALVLGIIVWFFRSAAALPLIFVPLLYGTFYTFGVVALPPLSILSLNSNTAFLGSIVVGNGINTGIILLARFREERARGLSVDDALRLAVSTSWRPTLAAAVAAAAAYGSLIFTDFRGFNQFGYIGAAGMLMCWLATFVLAPPLVHWLGASLRAPSKAQKARRPLLARALAMPRLVLASTLLLSVVAGIGIQLRSGDWLEHDFSKLRRRDSWETGERYWGGRMDATLGTYLTPTVVLTSNPEATRRIEKALIEVRDADQGGQLIASVRSVHTVLTEQRGEAIAEAKRLKALLTPRMKSELEPEQLRRLERALSDQALTPLRPEDLPDVLAAGMREHDGTMDRSVLIFPRLSGGTWEGQALEGFSADLRRVAAEEDPEAKVAGALLLSSDISRAMYADGPRATAIALGVVLVVAFLAFRVIGLSLAAVASLLVGVLVMLGAMAWLGMRLNFSNFVALPITFGIAADYSINMLKRIQSSGIGIQEAVRHTGGAVALCSATTIIGFGSLLVAQNQALFSFGVFATTGELTCLLTAVVAMPALLGLLGRHKPAAQESQLSSPAA